MPAEDEAARRPRRLNRKPSRGEGKTVHARVACSPPGLRLCCTAKQRGANDGAAFRHHAEMDMMKMLAEFRMPAMPDMEALAAAQRRNLEALSAANRVALEGAQAVARRHMEILQQSVAEMTRR